MTLVRRPPSDKEELDGCSSVAVLPDALLAGHTILAQGWDACFAGRNGTVILQILRDDGPDLMIVTEAGQLARYKRTGAGYALGPVCKKHIILKFLDSHLYLSAVNFWNRIVMLMQ